MNSFVRLSGRVVILNSLLNLIILFFYIFYEDIIVGLEEHGWYAREFPLGGL